MEQRVRGENTTRRGGGGRPGEGSEPLWLGPRGEKGVRPPLGGGLRRAGADTGRQVGSCHGFQEKVLGRRSLPCQDSAARDKVERR